MEITAKQYAASRGITLQAVTKMIREKNKLPSVQSITRFGKIYRLKVKKDFVVA